jgi:long-chain alkane monooxygenase
VIFLADIVGVYDVYRGGPAPSIVDAVQIPVNASSAGWG